MYNFKILEKELKKASEWFSSEIVSLRTGRANPALVEHIKVNSYGSDMPIEHIAAVSVEDARTILIKPWDKSNVQPIESAIRASNLGLQPVVDQENIRIILPELTEERRTSLKKILREKLEDAKVTARQARDEVWSDIQEQERAGTISEDDKFRLKDDMQEIVDKAIKSLDEIADKKESEINS